MATTFNHKICSDLRINGQRMQFILLLRLCRSIEGPGNLGNWSSTDGDWDIDAVSCPACQQIVGTHIQTEDGLNWQIERILGQVSVRHLEY